MLSPFIILGGIYGGIFTATEAAGVSVAYGALVGYFIFKRLSLRQFFRSCIETGVSTSVILFLIGAAAAFGWLLTVLQLPTLLTNAIRSFTENPAVVLLLCNIVLLIAGALLDNAAAITLLTPVLVPLVKSYGIDTTYFGLIMIINLALQFYRVRILSQATNEREKNKKLRSDEISRSLEALKDKKDD